MGVEEAAPRDSLKITVLAGGTSAERDISLKSGENVARALESRGHQVTVVDPAETDPATADWSGIDCVFLALHGPGGEDGRIQELLEQAGVPFTGCSSVVSRLAFSKSATKERLAQHHVPTPAYVLIHESDDASAIAQKAKQLGFPLVVKPDCQGSSFGVTIVESEDQLPAALSECFHYDQYGLLESAVSGSEFTLGLLDSTPLPLIEIATEREFFDFAAKYTDEETDYRFEFAHSTNVVQAIATAGAAAAKALETTGLVRVDLRVDRYGQPWVLELNTIPGFTDHSLIPKAAEHAGIGFASLCDQSVRLAIGAAANSRTTT